MAFTKKSWQDHLSQSFGQESETARASKDGLVMGGVYNATPPTIADGEFARAQVNANGFLVVSGTVNNTPVGSFASAKATVVVTTPAAVGTVACALSGLARWVTQVTPALEGTGTATTKLVDSLGGTVFAFAAQVESATTAYGTVVPLTSDMSFVTTCDGTQSANRSIILDIHYEK